MKMKKFFSMLLAVLMVMTMFTACGKKEPEPQPEPDPEPEKVAVTVTVWGPQEDQSSEKGNWLQTSCEAFAKLHPEWEITFKYGVCSEGDAKTNVATDPSAAADVYLFANDQIPDLVKAGALAELGGSVVETAKKNQGETAVNTVTYNGSVYGIPFTGNTWFMYYDKSVFSDEDIKSLDAMLEKGKVAFPLTNSWYFASFYVANGCTLFGPTQTEESKGIDFSGDKAVAVTDYLVDLVANKNFGDGDVGSVEGANAFFSGTWDASKAQDAYGDNLGAACLPSITINGELKQLKSFAGTKAVGVNPSTALYKEHPEIAVALAAYLGGTEAQTLHYQLRGDEVIPTDTNVSTGTNVVAKAQVDTIAKTSIVQPVLGKMGNYWGPAGSMGAELIAKTVTHSNAAEKTEEMNTAMNSEAVN
ncbi:MAG: extracellular solute-binding protein [Oscillospiraceae bacterium]|nr:extracellular solute-binding protein [Oscillospiraceae bacterium]MBR5045325.1 extracellular solute-binding protein [Oscillospiraceae bacterium]